MRVKQFFGEFNSAHFYIIPFKDLWKQEVKFLLPECNLFRLDFIDTMQGQSLTKSMKNTMSLKKTVCPKVESIMGLFADIEKQDCF